VDQPCAVLVLECADAAGARAVLRTLPLVQAGLIDFELIPLKPYPGFARLFGDEETQGQRRAAGPPEPHAPSRCS